MAFLTYRGAQLPSAIRWGKPLSVAFKEILDGLLYGLVTAGAFGWLWPVEGQPYCPSRSRRLSRRVEDACHRDVVGEG